MAKMDVEGMDDMLDMLKAAGELIGETADNMLQAGADEIVKAWKETAEAHDFKDSGEMIAAIAPTEPKTAGGIREITVYPQGKDSTGTRNAEKAFILHYGSSKHEASQWVDEAEALAEERVVEACEREMDRFLGQGG